MGSEENEEYVPPVHDFDDADDDGLGRSEEGVVSDNDVNGVDRPVMFDADDVVRRGFLVSILF